MNSGIKINLDKVFVEVPVPNIQRGPIPKPVLKYILHQNMKLKSGLVSTVTSRCQVYLVNRQ